MARGLVQGILYFAAGEYSYRRCFRTNCKVPCLYSSEVSTGNVNGTEQRV